MEFSDFHFLQCTYVQYWRQATVIRLVGWQRHVVLDLMFYV